MNWLQKLARFEEGIPPILAGLANEARKYASPDDFQRAFLGEIKHGMYWHVTDDPNFFIDPQKGPTDMSSMGSGTMSPGKLMLTSDLGTWATNYAPHRRYAALVDMSFVDPQQYTQVNRGFGNEFFVNDPSKAKVVGVFPIKDALRIDYEHHESLPQNFGELSEFWQKSQESGATHLSKERLLSHSEHLDDVTWEEQWKEDWAPEWVER
ncbi:MAG: hypothetical protein ACXAC5_02495 [Promethearchaeota archaeon]|jgi:hypothetical protein